MPRLPILSVVEWRDVFESARSYGDWLEQAEFEENVEKMEQFRKSLNLDPQVVGFISGISRTVHVLAIAEDWCGDVVRHVPVLQKLSELSSNIGIRYIFREEQPEVFVRYLTNGGEAIPKFVFLNQDFIECGNWGPMPEGCREMIARGKACGDVGEARRKVALRYQADENKQEVIRELVHLFDIASTQKP